MSLYGCLKKNGPGRCYEHLPEPQFNNGKRVPVNRPSSISNAAATALAVALFVIVFAGGHGALYLAYLIGGVA